MLHHAQYMAALKANDEVVPLTDQDRVINFLPFTHVFERGWAYLALTEGAQLIINTNPHRIQESMRETHPTCMSSVGKGVYSCEREGGQCQRYAEKAV